MTEWDGGIIVPRCNISREFFNGSDRSLQDKWLGPQLIRERYYRKMTHLMSWL